MISEPSYQELLESCSRFNKRICLERRHRLPFVDALTGVAQSDSHLWRDEKDRRTVVQSSDSLDYGEGVVYSYPARRWRRRANNCANLMVADIKNRALGTLGGADNHIAAHGAAMGDSSQTFGLENEAGDSRGAHADFKSDAANNNDGATRSSGAGENSANNNNQWYDDNDHLGEDPYYDDLNSDYEDLEEQRKHRKKAPKRKTNRTRKNQETDFSKLYICPHCSAKYKTKPGLQYHILHVHNENPPQPPSCTLVPTPPGGFDDSRGDADILKYAPPYRAEMASSDLKLPKSEKTPKQEPDQQQNVGKFCDFCLGDAEMNKKTLRPEQLVSCKDCGRSGHPTCLQFTPNMVVSTKRHGWQCIDCKSCAVCGTSENDDQLLFCDDCDRGFHMYCLKPPLLSAPEGNWSCHLCIEEFGSAASNPGN